MKKLSILVMSLTACTIGDASITPMPDAAAPPPIDAAVPVGTASCTAQLVGPLLMPDPVNTGPCWMQVTADIRCPKYVEQRPRRIALWWNADGPPLGGGGYVQTTYECDRIVTAVFYNTLCTGVRISASAQFEDPLRPGFLDDQSPICQVAGVPLDPP